MSKKPKPDQHASGFLVRFPEELRPVFDAIKQELGQPYTVAARRAMLDYARKHGIEGAKIEGAKEDEK